MTASKAELRRLVRESTDRGDDQTLIPRFLALPAYRAAQTVLLYCGAGSEIDTRPILVDALRAGKTVALPKITGRGLMEARRIASLDELVPGKFDIPAPSEGCGLVPPDEIDLILVPGAAFTKAGARLGRGGGYYDRYLPQTHALKVALARSGQLFDELPTEPHDVKVDIVITAL